MPKNEKNVREITEKKAQKAAQARRAAESDVPSNLPLLVSGSLLVLVVAVLVLVMQQAPTEAAGQDDDAATGADATEAEAPSVPVMLSASDPPQLRTVFSSKPGEAWLVWCSDSGTALPGGGEARALLDEVAPLVRNIATVGILDCSAALPSKKTTYVKLGIEKSKFMTDAAQQPPVMFLSANGKKAAQLPVDKLSAETLVRILMKATTPVRRQATHGCTR